MFRGVRRTAPLINKSCAQSQSRRGYRSNATPRESGPYFTRTQRLGDRCHDAFDRFLGVCHGGGNEMTDSLREAGRLKLIQLFGFCRLLPLERLLLVELAIALISSGVDLSPVDGILDGTAALMGV